MISSASTWVARTRWATIGAKPATSIWPRWSRAPLSDELRQRVVERLRHEALPCPALGLELVVYRRETACSGTVTSDFELNLNTGSRLPMRVDSRAAPGESHWFPIDRSMLAQSGVALLGPPAGEVFGPISPEALTPILVDSLRWHRAHLDRPSDAVLNACRSLRFAIEGRWSSKLAAGRWAVERGLAPRELVERASAARRRRSADPARHPADFAALAPRGGRRVPGEGGIASVGLISRPAGAVAQAELTDRAEPQSCSPHACRA